MSFSERLVGGLAYPAYEWLRGRPTLRCYREMLALSRRPAEAVAQVARQRLRALLCYAADTLPYYRELFARHGVDPRAADPYAELARLPILTKKDVRENTAAMVCRDVPGGPIPCGSGGTSGDTLHFFIDRARQAQALGCRLFMQSLFGVRPGDRRAYLWGSPIETRGTRLRQFRDRLLNEVLLDAYDMSPASMDAQLEALRAFRPRLLYAYPSAAALLARHAGARFGPRDFPWLRLAVLTGEEITPEQRARVRATFGCRVVAEYGSREVGLIAHECPHGSLHIMSPHLHVEVLEIRAAPCPRAEQETGNRSDRQTSGATQLRPYPATDTGMTGRVGEVLCTTLTTRAQPFIRYRLGDLGALEPQPCPCGLPFPRMRLEGGRTSGFVALPDGRLCYGSISSCVLREERGIVEFKTYQHALDRFEVLLVVDTAFDPRAIERIQRRYRTLFGPHVRVSCRIVDSIPPDPSGKRRHVVSAVAPDLARFETAAGSRQ